MKTIENFKCRFIKENVEGYEQRNSFSSMDDAVGSIWMNTLESSKALVRICNIAENYFAVSFGGKVFADMIIEKANGTFNVKEMPMSLYNKYEREYSEAI